MTKLTKFLDKHPGLQKLYGFIKSAVELYLNKNADAAAAHLAFNLMLSLFPLLICLNALLSGLNITSHDVLEWGRGIIPAAALKLFGDYTDYINEKYSVTMLIGAIALILGAGAGAFRGVVGICRKIMGADIKGGILHFILSFVFAVGFLLAIYITIVVILVGGAMPHIRFVLLFVTLFAMIWGIYRVAAPGKRHFFGALLAAIALELTGLIFSYTIEMSSNYPLVYGSLSALIYLMLWLFLCGNIMIVGAILNAKLAEREARRIRAE